MPYKVVKEFEETIADYCRSKYAVSVSSCTNAIFLCLLYNKENLHEVNLPKHTYIGVAASVVNAGLKIKFRKDKWLGSYVLFPSNIIDSALSFKKDMHIPGYLTCLSFHNRKHIPIGRGGMILTDSKKTYDWLRLARFDGREEKPLRKQTSFTVCGWNMYMTPEQAARGLVLFNNIKDKDLPDIDDYDTYPDLSEMEIFI